MNTGTNCLAIDRTTTETNNETELSIASENAEDSDPLPALWQEYDSLVKTLRKQGNRKDVALLIRLMILKIDLGLYHPSAP